jgi:hypothetical protein
MPHDYYLFSGSCQIGKLFQSFSSLSDIHLDHLTAPPKIAKGGYHK